MLTELWRGSRPHLRDLVLSGLLLVRNLADLVQGQECALCLFASHFSKP